jgi:hypothetical protein
MGNSAPTAGGSAITVIAHSATASPQLINCVFTGNHAPTSAAVSAFVTGTGVSRPEFINSAFSGNVGGSVRISNIGTGSCALIARNSIFWGNDGGAGISAGNADIDLTHSIIPFGFPGDGNIGLDPMFVNQPPIDSAHVLGDLHLQKGSPAIDAGRNSDVPAGVTTDLDGNPRLINPFTGLDGVVDIGPYEIQEATSAVRAILPDGDWSIFPNPAHEQLSLSIVHSDETTFYELLDARGKVISRSDPFAETDFTIPLAKLPAGVYFVHLVQSTGHGVKTVIVE